MFAETLGWGTFQDTQLRKSNAQVCISTRAIKESNGEYLPGEFMEGQVVWQRMARVSCRMFIIALVA